MLDLRYAVPFITYMRLVHIEKIFCYIEAFL